MEIIFNNNTKIKITKQSENDYLVTYYEMINGKFHSYDKGNKCSKDYIEYYYGKFVEGGRKYVNL